MLLKRPMLPIQSQLREIPVFAAEFCTEQTIWLSRPKLFAVISKISIFFKDFLIFFFHFSARQTPFAVGVHFDDTETVAIATNAMTSEAAVFSGGIVGFKLDWFQVSC